MYQTNMTRAELDTWVARLRDPESLQHRFGGCEDEKLRSTVKQPMCCLVHGIAVLKPSESLSLYGYWPVMDQYLGSLPVIINGKWMKLTDHFAEMNDEHGMTLNQIADWAVANLSVKDEPVGN